MSLFSRLRMPVLALALAGAALAGSFGAGATQHAFALTNCTVNDLSVDGEEQAFLGLINQYRAQNGLGALTMSANLNRAASWMAIDMAQKAYFSHTDSLGRSPSTRATDCGYPQGAGENIAAGTVWSTAQAAFDAWKASAGHNANMLGASYRQIGIARYYQAGSQYGWYWVTDFGLTNDGTTIGGSGGGTTTPPPPPPASTAATITSPANGSTLAGSSATFAWNAGSGAQQYFFYAGTSAGANNLYGQSQGLNRSLTVNGLPTNGSAIYVRLWTLLPSGWAYQDTQYRAATTGGAVTTAAAIVSPVAGSLLPAGAVTFTWSTASGGQEYFFYLGTAQGANNLYGWSQGLNTTLTLNVPPHSSALWVRLWARTAAGWTYTDYQYR